MLILALALSTAPMIAPDKDLIGHFYAAIWDDLELNAIIGNGNWLAQRWSDAEVPRGTHQHIRDLTCRTIRMGYHCSFKLIRDGGSSKAFGKPAPDELVCGADFRRGRGDEAVWVINHLPPPPDGGHSRTSMTCVVAPET